MNSGRRSMGAFTENQLILITGASGFIGSHLTHTLLASFPPVRLRLLARPSSDLRAFEGHPKVQSVRVERWDSAERLRQAFREVDYVFHTAAACVDWAKLEDFEEANVTMAKRLVEAAIAERRGPDSRMKRFLHISTADVYGFPGNGPSEDVPPQCASVLVAAVWAAVCVRVSAGVALPSLRMVWVEAIAHPACRLCDGKRPACRDR